VVQDKIKESFIAIRSDKHRCDIIKSLKNPSDHFTIQFLITILPGLLPVINLSIFLHHQTNKETIDYNYRTFNSLRTIDLTKPFLTIKARLIQILYNSILWRTSILATYTVFIFLVPAAFVPNIPSHQTLMYTMVSN